MRALVLALLLSGCSLLPGAGSVAMDGQWRLQAGTNQGHAVPIVAGSQITLKIDGDQVAGSSACNIYGGMIRIHGTSIAISALSMTEMACQENLMASEAAYLAALPRATTAARNGTIMVLTGPHVELRFVLVPPVADADLVGTAWVLESLISGDVVSSTVGEATLRFSDDGRFAASTGCREVTGSYKISEARVRMTLDPYDTIGCAAPIGDQDAHILAVLSLGFGVAIDGSRLTLTAGDRGLDYRAGIED